jgi:hypothetical protein
MSNSETPLDLTDLIRRSDYPLTYGSLTPDELGGNTVLEAKVDALMADPAAYFEAARQVHRQRVAAELAIQNS